MHLVVEGVINERIRSGILEGRLNLVVVVTSQMLSEWSSSSLIFAEITRGGIYIKAEKACFLSMVNFLDIMQTAPTAKYPLDVTTSGDKCKRLIGQYQL